MKKIAIIGAGISGLSVANFLKDQYTVTVFEKDYLPGGLVKCLRISGGGLFHTCGGHVFNSKRQDVLDWFWSKFNRETDFAKTYRNAVVFMDGGQEIPYPIENNMYRMGESEQKAFINDLLQIARGKYPEPKDFEEFLKGRFGETLYKMYFQPYNEKVWRRDLSNVPLSWLEGKLPMPTVEEMIYNNINHVEERSFVHSSFWYEKINGSQFIVDRLARDLDIRCNSDIKEISYTGEQWIVSGEAYEKVVYCGNIKDMVHLIKGVDLEDFIEPVDKLEYHGTTAVFCEIDRNPYSWIYQPSRTHKSHRIICTGNFSPTNNDATLPKDRITATVEFTDDISKDEIMEQLKLIPLHPKYITHQYNKYTYPIQDADTRGMIQDIKQRLMPFGMYFTGRFADWEYYNMDVAIGAAKDLSDKINNNSHD